MKKLLALLVACGLFVGCTDAAKTPAKKKDDKAKTEAKTDVKVEKTAEPAPPEKKTE